MNDITLIFDFDGTIADTHHYIVEISNRLSQEFQYNKIDRQELPRLKDKTSQEIIQHLQIPLLKIPAIITRAKKEFQNDIASLEPIAGIKEILLKLKTSGRSLGILSSNARDNIVSFLKQHDLDIFDFIHTTSMVWSKDASVKKLMRLKNLKPEQTFYVGDEIRDIVAAQRLSIKMVAVSWGYNSAAALGAYQPDYLLNHPQELLQFCRDNTPSPLADISTCS